MIGPIYAQFSAVDATTLYAIVPKPGNLRIVWALTPPTNAKKCGLFAAYAKTPRIAAWRHGDSDGCDNAHPEDLEATVKVTASNAAWVCTATYVGTDTGTGDYGRCVKRAKPKH